MGETRKQEIAKNNRTPKDTSEMTTEEIMNNASELYINKNIADPEFSKLIKNCQTEEGE